MRDIPAFTTENGVAGIILKEIPYNQTAYVTIHDSLDPDALLQECLGFCRAVGAQRVFVAEYPGIQNIALHSRILRMSASKAQLEESDAYIFPVTEQTAERFRNLYNEKMAETDHAAFLSVQGMKELLEKGSAYFIHKNEQLLGIGIGSGDTLDAVASTVAGAGETVVRTMCHALSGESVFLEVSSTNTRAIRLYERLGFAVIGEGSRWYKIL